MLAESFKAAAQKYQAELSHSCPGTLSGLAISACVTLNSKPTPMRHYIYLPTRLRKHLDRVERRYGSSTLSLLLKYLLCCCVLDAITRLQQQLDSKQLSTVHQSLFYQWFERMLEDLSKQAMCYYHHRDGDGYRQDLAVAGLRAMPIGGAWLVEVIYHRHGEFDSHPVITDFNNLAVLDRVTHNIKQPSPKALIRVVLRRLIPQALKDAARYSLKWLGVRLNQYELYVVIHTASRERHKFTPKQMTQAYHHIAELLILRKELKGLYRASWLLDPALKKISPRLAFLWELPCSHGAELIYIKPNHEDKPFLNSSARQQAHERGDYIPQTYAYHWDRQQLLAWAEQQAKPAST